MGFPDHKLCRLVRVPAATDWLCGHSPNTINPSDLECKIWLASRFVRHFAQVSSCVAEAIWGVSWITHCQDC